MTSSSSLPHHHVLGIVAATILLLSGTSMIHTSHSFAPPATSRGGCASSLPSSLTSQPSFHLAAVPSFALSKHHRDYHQRSSGMILTMANSNDDDAEVEFVPADDGEALQALFAKHCNSEGLMTQAELRAVPAIGDMLDQGELLSQELSDIWNSAPKFPSLEDEKEEVEDKIDVDSFIQVYRDIDDLFEQDANDSAAKNDDSSSSSSSKEEPTTDSTTNDNNNDDEDAELEQTFLALLQKQQSKDSTTTTLSFSELRQWDEITLLIEEEGMLGEDEFKTLWNTCAVGVVGEDGSMDLNGFLKFNLALDDLFVFDDEDDEDDDDDDADDDADDADDDDALEDDDSADTTTTTKAPLPIITEQDLPPGVLFSQLANENYLVGTKELKRWGELNDMLSNEDLTSEELETLFGNADKAPGTKDMLDEDGFMTLYDAIDALFEDDVDGDDNDNAASAAATKTATEEEMKVEEKDLKFELLEFIEDFARVAEAEGRQPCGLDCNELEQERVLEVVAELEREPYNLVVDMGESGSNAVDKEELVGLWDLIYSSSSTMKYNEGLSGLAGGLTKFGGVQQRLTATKYLSDVEYIEQVIGKLGEKSYEVKVTGDWELRTEISLFTGKPSNVLSVTPDKVSYGPRSDKADHWKSLGPLNLLVLSFLDEDLRIMRGSTSTDTLFIFRRVK